MLYSLGRAVFVFGFVYGLVSSIIIAVLVANGLQPPSVLTTIGFDTLSNSIISVLDSATGGWISDAKIATAATQSIVQFTLSLALGLPSLLVRLALYIPNTVVSSALVGAAVVAGALAIYYILATAGVLPKI